jgi:hypothetical protein
MVTHPKGELSFCPFAGRVSSHTKPKAKMTEAESAKAGSVPETAEEVEKKGACV